MKKLSVCFLMLALGGCASAPRPQMMVLPHKAPAATTAPAPAAAPPMAKPATFKERWQEFRKKHPVKWVH